jgi:hypothetical protein
MNKRLLCPLIFVAVSGFSISTACAYTAIAFSEASTYGPHFEMFGYSHLPAQPQNVVEKRALESCTLAGGTNPKIVASTGKPGYSAVAGSKSGRDRVLGWAVAMPSKDAAEKKAIEECRKHGGTDPRIRASWVDHATGWKGNRS